MPCSASKLEHAGVERPAAQVVDEDALLELLSMPEGERGRGGLIEDALHVQAGQRAGLAHRLALVVVVVRGDGDHRPVDLGLEPLLCDALHLGQHQRRDLLQRELPVPELHRRFAARSGHDLVGKAPHQIADRGRLELAAHQPLRAVDGVAGIDQELRLRRVTDDQVALVVDGHDGRDGVVSLA
jgi:hypothetical protein